MSQSYLKNTNLERLVDSLEETIRKYEIAFLDTSVFDPLARQAERKLYLMGGETVETHLAFNELFRERILEKYPVCFTLGVRKEIGWAARGMKNKIPLMMSDLGKEDLKEIRDYGDSLSQLLNFGEATYPVNHPATQAELGSFVEILSSQIQAREKEIQLSPADKELISSALYNFTINEKKVLLATRDRGIKLTTQAAILLYKAWAKAGCSQAYFFESIQRKKFCLLGYNHQAKIYEEVLTFNEKEEELFLALVESEAVLDSLGRTSLVYKEEKVKLSQHSPLRLEESSQTSPRPGK